MACVQSAARLHMHRHACRHCCAAVLDPCELPAGEGQVPPLTWGVTPPGCGPVCFRSLTALNEFEREVPGPWEETCHGLGPYGSRKGFRWSMAGAMPSWTPGSPRGAQLPPRCARATGHSLVLLVLTVAFV